MNRIDYQKLKIRNLYYDLTFFIAATGIAIYTIASIGSLMKSEEKPILTVKAIEIDTKDEPLILQNSIISYEELINQSVMDDYNLDNTLNPIIIDNEYSGMKLSNEYEDEIKRLADIYGIPYEIVLTIGYRESAGNWNNNGVVSTSNDYGAFQINECNLGYIEENLGYTKEEILNDPVKNVEACMYLLKDIIKRDDVDTVEQVFGMYNGWIGWENKPLAASYSSACLEIINEYFPNFEYKKNQNVK